MHDNWEMFFKMLIKHEGGFTDDERDNGNAKVTATVIMGRLQCSA